MRNHREAKTEKAPLCKGNKIGIKMPLRCNGVIAETVSFTLFASPV